MRDLLEPSDAHFRPHMFVLKWRVELASHISMPLPHNFATLGCQNLWIQYNIKHGAYFFHQQFSSKSTQHDSIVSSSLQTGVGWISLKTSNEKTLKFVNQLQHLTPIQNPGPIFVIFQNPLCIFTGPYSNRRAHDVQPIQISLGISWTESFGRSSFRPSKGQSASRSKPSW